MPCWQLPVSLSRWETMAHPAICWKTSLPSIPPAKPRPRHVQGLFRRDNMVSSRHHAPRAVVLLSGGLDSTTVLAIAREQGFETFALSLDYGQRHRAELDAAVRVAAHLAASEHRIIKLDLTGWGGSALTDRNIAVPVSDI